MSKSKSPSKKDGIETLRLLKRHLHKGVTIRALAVESGLSERTLYRDLATLKKAGASALVRTVRSDKGKRRKVSEEVQKAIEGLCLRADKPPVAWVHREVAEICRAMKLSVPSYMVVLDIYRQLDKRLKVLAHEGDAAYEQEYDPLLRREADHPNDMWQCDHKELKIWAVDPHTGKTGKVFITAIIDDFSRVVPGYLLAVGKPNSMRIAAALRQGIWTKQDKDWPVAGIPDIFYSDHGADFVSTHIEQVAGDLHMQLVNTIVYKPRGRGKIERLFRTIIQKFYPSYKRNSRDSPVQLSDLDSAFQQWLQEYHNTKHKEIKSTPLQKWHSEQFLPRLPDSIEALDLMLMKVAKEHKMFRDGIHLFNRRYSHELLTESIGQRFDVRYDPRDFSIIWVFGSSGQFLCKATAQGIHPTKQEVETVMSNRQRVKKRLKLEVKDKQSAGEEFIGSGGSDNTVQIKKEPPKKTVRLRLHFYERN